MAGWFLWLNTPLIIRFLKPFFENQTWFQQSFNGYLSAPLRWLGGASDAFILISGSIWIFLMKGDETLEKYPGMFMFPMGRAKRIRFYWIALTAFMLIASNKFWVLKLFPNTFFDGKNGMDSFFIGFLFLFVGGWALASYSLSAISGWQWLSEGYLFKDRFDGERHGGISGILGSMGLRGIFTTGANREGLYLSVMFLFRLGHPPLLIPWNEMTCEKRRFLFREYSVMEFRKAPGVFLMIPSKVTDVLAEEAGNKKARKILNAN